MGGHSTIRRHRAVISVAAAACAVAGLAAAPPSTAASSGRGLHNIPPAPWFLEACDAHGFDSISCERLTVAAIDNARRSEGLGYPLILPDDFRTLTLAEQAFVVINLERVDRGLRPFAGLVAQLDNAALPAAIHQVDPTPATRMLRGLGVSRFRTLWANSFGPLASDYDWMYNDGYSPSGNPNVDCSSAGANGCWAHRRAILETFAGQPLLLAGAAAAADSQGMLSLTVILTGGVGPPPELLYTWRQALRHGADGD